MGGRVCAWGGRRRAWAGVGVHGRACTASQKFLKNFQKGIDKYWIVLYNVNIASGNTGLQEE